MKDRVIIRPLDEADAIPPITRLLHEAYAPLAAMNLRYTATHQSDEVTRARFAKGLPWVAVLEEEIVATVTLYPVTEADSGCGWYGKQGVFSFGQFAVRPDLQGQGLGARLIALLEEETTARGGTELALDTAEEPLHLIRWYEKLGFRFVEFMDWPSTNYRSVVMSKTLIPQTGHLG